MMAAVQVAGLCKRFGRRWALAHVNVCVPQGATVLLTGENGAGKTTLLRILATVMKPTLGQVQWFGQSATPEKLPQLRRRIGLLTHETHHYDELSACENLQLAQRLRGYGGLADIWAALEEVGLKEHGAREVRGFSAGMKRRLGFARLLLGRADLLLLDEPFGQLDPAGVSMVEGLVRRMQARGCTTILSTHDIDRGASLSDMSLPLAKGRQPNDATVANLSAVGHEAEP